MVKGVSGGIRIIKPTKRFKQAITINQVGAKPIQTKRGTFYKLGEGLFTKRQVLASRQRMGRIAYGIKGKKADFGM